MSSLESRSFIKRGAMLVPADMHAEEFLAALPDGKEILLNTRKPRSPEHNRFFFAMLRKVCDHSRFPDVDQLLDAIKLVVGHSELRMKLDGTFEMRPKSIDFASMDEEAFKRFKKRALWAIHTHLGLDAEALMEEVAGDQQPTDLQNTGGALRRPSPASGEASVSLPAAEPELPPASSETSLSMQPAPADDGAGDTIHDSGAPVAPGAAAVAAPPQAIPPKVQAASAAVLSRDDKALLRKYAKGLADARIEKTLQRGSTAFLEDHRIEEGTARHAAAVAIFAAHLTRVKGNSSPTEADAVVDKVLA